MSKKQEDAKALFKQGYNCTQSVFGVFCEELGLDFNTAMKIALPFGGGMGRMREVCGAVSGMLMAAGLIFSNENATNKPEEYAVVQELAKRFKDDNKSIICKELLSGLNESNSYVPSVRDEDYYKKRPCIELVSDAVGILEQLVKEKKIIVANDVKIL